MLNMILMFWCDTRHEPTWEASELILYFHKNLDYTSSSFCHHANRVLFFYRLNCIVHKTVKYLTINLTLKKSFSDYYIIDNLFFLSLTIPLALQNIISYNVSEHAHKQDIMEISSRCYMVAISIQEGISSYWHDLAVCTYFHAMV